MASLFNLKSALALFAALSMSVVVYAENVDSTASGSSCVTNRSGTVVSALAGNGSINGAIASVGGIRGLLTTWSSGSGTVRFYQTSSGRLVLSYDYGLVSGAARITKVCAISGSILKMNGAVQGDPFVMYVRGIGNPRALKMGVELDNLKDFSKR